MAPLPGGGKCFTAVFSSSALDEIASIIKSTHCEAMMVDDCSLDARRNAREQGLTLVPFQLNLSSSVHRVTRLNS
jgi:hypothetical protein